MTYEDWTGWVTYLWMSAEISIADQKEIVDLLKSAHSFVRVNGVYFCIRMQKEHPDLWVAYLAKRRLLGQKPIV